MGGVLLHFVSLLGDRLRVVFQCIMIDVFLPWIDCDIFGLFTIYRYAGNYVG